MARISSCLVLAGLLAGSIALAIAQSPSPPGDARPAVGAGESSAAKAPSRYLPNRFAGRAGRYYKVVWGVDSLSAKLVESGEVIRFSWRVLDADLAKALSDKKAEPSLVDPQAGVSLVVPSVENVGMLRQSAPPVAGKNYWMAFSNKGRMVKRGDRIDVLIGQFRANGLVVD